MNTEERGEPKHAASPLQHAHPRSGLGVNSQAVWSASDKNKSREARGRRAAHIKEQNDFSTQSELSSGLRSDQNDEKAVRQQDGLLFQGRIVPTEFRKDHQNFLAKSYWAAKGSVKEFFENKCLCFQ
jgi:hypothetical protein